MVSNAQLHNEKSTLMYQVETLREELNEMEERLWETRRRCDDAHKVTYLYTFIFATMFDMNRVKEKESPRIIIIYHHCVSFI